MDRIAFTLTCYELEFRADIDTSDTDNHSQRP